MKEAIHPTYYPDATVHCSGCDREFTVGSTAKQIRVELCSQCHPFYTGKQKLVDTAGRVERFQARAAKADRKKQGRQKQAKQSQESAGTGTASGDSGDEPTPAERLAAMKQDLEQRDR